MKENKENNVRSINKYVKISILYILGGMDEL